MIYPSLQSLYLDYSDPFLFMLDRKWIHVYYFLIQSAANEWRSLIFVDKWIPSVAKHFLHHEKILCIFSYTEYGILKVWSMFGFMFHVPSLFTITVLQMCIQILLLLLLSSEFIYSCVKLRKFLNMNT